MKTILRTVSLILVTVFMIGSLVACGGNPDDTKPKDTTAPSTPVDEDPILDSVPTDLRYDGETVTFFTRNSEGNVELFDYEICCEELMNDALYDAIHYRNIDVETRLGLEIKQIGQAGAYSVAKTWFETLASAVNTQSSDYDAAAIYSTYGAPYALQNLYYNLNELSVQYSDGGGYLDYDQEWWNQSVINDCNLYGALYFLAGDLAVSGTYGTHLLWFNKDLFDESFPEEGGYKTLYSTVHDDKWTIDKMANYVSQVWGDANTNGVADDGDTLGFKYFEYKERAQMSSWFYALGVDLLEQNAYGEYSIGNFAPRLIPAIEKVAGMYNGEGSMTSQGTRQDDASALGKGNVLFQVGAVNDGNDYRGTTVNYGALPMPKFDEDQEQYGNGMWTYSTFLTVLNHLSPERAKMVSAVLEILAAESYQHVTPAYYDQVITGRYAKEEEDSKMLDIAVRTCCYGFEQIYASSIGSSLMNLFNNLQADPQTTIDANIDTTWPTNLEKLLDDLEAIA